MLEKGRELLEKQVMMTLCVSFLYVAVVVVTVISYANVTQNSDEEDKVGREIKS